MAEWTTSTLTQIQYLHIRNSMLTTDISSLLLRTTMEGVPITNTLFPPPPGYYKAFTKENVERYADLTAGSMEGDASDSEELAKLRDELSPPRVDWVREDARWMLFGQMYTVSTFLLC